jgi:hypothetical protein
VAEDRLANAAAGPVDEGPSGAGPADAAQALASAASTGVRPVVLHGVLGLLSLLTALALVHAAFFSDVPPPAAAAWERIGWPTHEKLVGETTPAQAGRKFTHGGITRFEARPREAGGVPFAVALAAVRTRSHVDLHRGFLAESLPGMTLEVDGPPRLGTGPMKGTQFALGNAGGRRMLQSCIAPDGTTGVDDLRLVAAIGDQRERGLHARVRQVLGLQPPSRWECAWVAISVEPGPAADEQLQVRWGELLAMWKARAPWPVAGSPAR